MCRRALQHHDRFRDGVRRIDLVETWKRGNYQGGEEGSLIIIVERVVAEKLPAVLQGVEAV